MNQAINEVPTHTLSILVLDKPGVLTRVTALFSRRGFNIDSLSVGQTEDPTISRISVVARADEETVEQVIKQLNKLVEVLKVVELEDTAVNRELLLIKVRAGQAERGQILQILQLFGAQAVDISPETVTVEAVGSPNKLHSLLEILDPYGIKELVQSGLVAINRGGRSISERSRSGDKLRPIVQQHAE